MWRRSRFRETILEMEEDVNETRRIRNVSWYGGGRKEWKIGYSKIVVKRMVRDVKRIAKGE